MRVCRLGRRKAETEADVIGMQMAARACYDPAAAVAVFEKLEEVGGRSRVECLAPCFCLGLEIWRGHWALICGGP